MLEGAIPGGEGFVVLAEAGVDIAEVVEDDGVVREFGGGFQHPGEGAAGVAFLVIDPGQAVEVGTVVGVEFDGLEDEAEGFIEADAFFGPGVAEVVHGLVVVGVEGEAFFEGGFHEGEVAGLLGGEGAAEVEIAVEHAGVVRGGEGFGLVEGDEGELVVALEVEGEGAEVGEGGEGGVGGLGKHGGGDGVLEEAGVELRFGEGEEGLGGGAAELVEGGVGVGRTFPLAGFAVKFTEGEVKAVAVGKIEDMASTKGMASAKRPRWT